MRGWISSSKRHPCGICGGTSWCCTLADGSTILCTRVKEGCMTRRDGSEVTAKNGNGWFHKVGESKGKPVKHQARDDRLSKAECIAMQKSFASAINPERLAKLSADLGLKEKVLRLFGIGYDSDHAAWTFPMYDGKLAICGFRTRDAGGSKRSIKGSRNGLFVPSNYETFLVPDCISENPYALLLLLPEGPTDAAAATQLGFRSIGRPSNQGGNDQLFELLGSGERQEVVIVADHDPVKHLKDGTPFVPGWDGALNLATKILPCCGVLRIMRPPGNLKDLRKWMMDGGTSGLLLALIENTETMTDKLLKQKIERMKQWQMKGREKAKRA